MHTELGRSQVKVQQCTLSWAGPRLRCTLSWEAPRLRSSGRTSWRRAWRRVGKAEVEVEVDADMAEEKLEEEARRRRGEEEEEEEDGEEEEDNNSDKIKQPSPGRWGINTKQYPHLRNRKPNARCANKHTTYMAKCKKLK